MRMGLATLVIMAGTVAEADQADWLSPGPTVPQAILQDQDGRSVSLVQLIDTRTVIVNFFFTGCAATCPLQTAQLALLQDEVAARESTDPGPLILSISLDPLGDTPESVRQYAENFDLRLGDQENWLMLTGNFNDLRPVWEAFGQESTAPADHTALFWIGHPDEGRWTRIYTLAKPSVLYDLLMDAAS